MTTITINERTKAGKAILELAKLLSESNKGVVIANPKKKSPYSPKFVAMVKEAEKQIAQGKTTVINPNDIWGSLGLK